MEMENYLSQIAPSQHFSIKPHSFFLRATQWIHKHTTLVKTTEIAGMILGAGAAVSTPWMLPFIGSWSFAIAAGGTLLAAISALFYTHFNIVAPLHHDMKTHVFKEGEIEGGRLYYVNDVPILELEYGKRSDSHRQAGHAQGYLTAPNMHALKTRFDRITRTVPRWWGYEGRATPEMIPETVKDLDKVIPPGIREELLGMVQGYNQWVEEQKSWGMERMTYNELLLWQLMPDAVHYTPFFEGLPLGKLVPLVPAPTPACTSIVAYDEEGGMILGRNMDWPSLGIAGKHSLVIRRKYRDRVVTAEVGIPGLVGTVTGINEHGVCLAMNICSGATQKVEGLPASIFNRLVLEGMMRANEIHEVVQHFSVLGPYHLTVADESEGIAYHFHQSGNCEEPHVIRRVNNGQPLVVTNCRYEPEKTCHRHYSHEREDKISALFHHADKTTKSNNGHKRLVAHALQMPYVNNYETTHTVLMHPKTRTMEVALDNAYAASAKRRVLSGEELFS